jgi:hypothetical protein
MDAEISDLIVFDCLECRTAPALCPLYKLDTNNASLMAWRGIRSVGYKFCWQGIHYQFSRLDPLTHGD